MQSPSGSPPHRAVEPFIVSADIVVPMDGDAIYREGGVVVDAGRIAAVGPLPDLRRQFGELRREHVPGIMLPGFVNTHCHSELTIYGYLSSDPLPFPQWVDALMQALPRDLALQYEMTHESVRLTVQESLAFGVTTLGDISREAMDTRQEFCKKSKQRLRVVSFGEVMALGAMRNRLEGSLSIAADSSDLKRDKEKFVQAGISPHAPYTVEGPALKKIVDHALKYRLPLAMHLAEHQEESDFLRDLSGPLGRSWKVMQRLKTLDDQVPLFDGGPIRWADHYGLLAASQKIPVILAHVNYCDDAELALLANSKISVAYCPRTRAYFGHDTVTPHRYREMLDAGINVCLGTDSAASNPDLSVLAEAAFLHQRDKISAQLAMEMITGRGAKALGLPVGKLAPGTWADIIVLPDSGNAGDSVESILTGILRGLPSPRAVWVAGQQMLGAV